MAFSLFADYEYGTIYELEPAWFQARGLRLVLLDFDNTVIPYTEKQPTEQFLAWRGRLEQAGISVMIVSNSRKSRRVPDFCEQIALPFIRHAGKPSPKGILRAMEQLQAQPRETVMAGDQTYTDILAANRAGVTSLLVRPLRFSAPQHYLRYAAELPWIAIARLRRRSRKETAK